MQLFKSIPLLIIPGIIYNFLAFLAVLKGIPLLNYLAEIPLPKGEIMLISVGDAITTMGIVLLFFEIVKSTNVEDRSIAEHIFSTFVFIGFMAEFMLAPNLAGTATFFFLTLMALLDVVAGFTITITAARRDFQIK